MSEQTDVLEGLLSPCVPVERVDASLECIEDVSDALADTRLRHSMASGGLWEPVVLGRTSDGQLPWTIIDGKRRVLAARQLGWETIRAEIFDPEDIPSIAAVRLITNQQRSPNPVDEYRALKVLLKRVNGDTPLPDIAGRLSLNLGHLRKLMRLDGLSVTLFEAFERGKMAFTTALRAAGLTNVEQDRLAQVYRESGRIRAKDVSEVRRVVKDEAVLALDDRLFERREATMEWFTPRMVTALEVAVARAMDGDPPYDDGAQIRSVIRIIRRIMGLPGEA